MDFINTLDASRRLDCSRCIFRHNYPDISWIAQQVLELAQLHPSTDFYTRFFIGIPNTLYKASDQELPTSFRVTTVAACGLGFINPKFSYLAEIACLLYHFFQERKHPSHGEVEISTKHVTAILIRATLHISGILANATGDRCSKSIYLIVKTVIPLYWIIDGMPRQSYFSKTTTTKVNYAYPTHIFLIVAQFAHACLAAYQLHQMAKGLR